MKIFLSSFSNPILTSVARKLREKSVDISYMVGSKREFEKIKNEKDLFPETIFHHYEDAAKGIPAEYFDISEFDPPSEDLIEKMLECESIVLSMMSRKDWNNSSIFQNRHLYYKYLQYWSWVLKKIKPDMIVFRAMPHMGFDYVLYCLAKYYGIKTLMFEAVMSLEDRLMIRRDHSSPPNDLVTEYKKIIAKQHTISDLGIENQPYHKRLLEMNRDITHKFVEKLRVRATESLSVVPSFTKIIKHVRSGTIINVAITHLKSALNISALQRGTALDPNNKTNYKNIYQLRKAEKITRKQKQEYAEFQSGINFNNKYIYFPLHYQPELSTCPMGGFFVDQILAIKILSAALPSDWTVYVKENILQWANKFSIPAFYRYTGYYKEIAALPNVELISSHISSNKLIRYCRAVAVITGTSGWEALVGGKPVLFFGYPWYMYCDGATRVTSVKECEEVIRDIQSGHRPDTQKVLNYLIALERITINGNEAEYMQRINNFPREKSIENITKAILDEI